MPSERPDVWVIGGAKIPWRDVKMPLSRRQRAWRQGLAAIMYTRLVKVVSALCFEYRLLSLIRVEDTRYLSLPDYYHFFVFAFEAELSFYRLACQFLLIL